MASTGCTSPNKVFKTKVSKTKTSSDMDAKAAQQSTDTAIVQCWMPPFVHRHYDGDRNLVEVSCHCKTCCSKSSVGNGFSFGTVEDWLGGHELNAWKDPLGSGFHVVAIKPYNPYTKKFLEKFLEKVHPEKYAEGVRFWMNFDEGRFDVRRPRGEKAQSGASAVVEQEIAPAQATQETAPAPAPKRPTFKPAPAVNPWGKGKAPETPKDASPEDEETARLMSAPIPKEKKAPMKKGGKWKQVETKLAPDSRHVVLDLAPIVAASAGPAGPRIAPFDLRLEKPCMHGPECRHKTHTETSKFVCPYNHHTTATTIAKGEPIPDSHCSYDKVTLVDGKVKIDKCKSKACTKDHLENHVAYCKGFAGASNAPAPVQQQPVQVVYVFPNGQTMMPQQMMMPQMMVPQQMPPQMPQFAPPRFHGKPQNKRRPPPPNRPLPVPKTQETLPEDAELVHIVATTAIDEDTESEQDEFDGCGGKRCGNMTPGFCTCDEEELEGEDDILARFAANVSVSQ
jgi:hypothetical protein